MRMIVPILITLVAAGSWLMASGAAEARIRCNGPFQVVPGAGEIATPYCQDEYLARVARGYGIQVSGALIRRNPHEKERVCRMIGHDSRVNNICNTYGGDRRQFRF